MHLKPDIVLLTVFLSLMGSVLVSCKHCNHPKRPEHDKEKPEKRDSLSSVDVDTVSSGKARKAAKFVCYLENSESMFGYVRANSEYISVVSELASFPAILTLAGIDLNLVHFTNLAIELSHAFTRDYFEDCLN